LEDHRLKAPKFKLLEKDFGINPEDTVFVTDSTGDIFEARSVDYKSIGITTGVHNFQELSEENPILIINNLSELRKYLKI
jgi:phosphoglycolate phosphatase-like HAD superfamily hydrolase